MGLYRRIQHYIKEVRYFYKRKILMMAIIRYFLTETPLTSFVNTDLYKKIYLAKIRRSAKSIKPVYFSFESTNYCNAKCIMCPYPEMKRKKANLDFKLFKIL